MYMITQLKVWDMIVYILNYSDKKDILLGSNLIKI